MNAARRFSRREGAAEALELEVRGHLWRLTRLPGGTSLIKSRRSLEPRRDHIDDTEVRNEQAFSRALPCVASLSFVLMISGVSVLGG